MLFRLTTSAFERTDAVERLSNEKMDAATVIDVEELDDEH